MKACNRCGTKKELCNFPITNRNRDGRAGNCKKCHTEDSKKWRERNPNNKKIWNDAHPKIVSRNNKRWTAAHPEQSKRIHRNWRINNPDATAAIQKRSDAKRRNTPVGKISDNMRRMLNYNLRGKKEGKHWYDLVGYSVEQLMAHLERQFRDGMAWENYGKWHVDHIRPRTSFDFMEVTDSGFKHCWALENLQPLWALENQTKGDRTVQWRNA